MIFGGITVLAGISATLIGGWLGDRLRRRWSGSYFLVSGVGMLVGTPLLLLMLITPFPAAWGLIFLAEFCVLLNTGPANAVLANVTQPAIRASAFAINIFLIHLLGDAISPPLVGWITGLAGGNMNFGFAAVSAATATQRPLVAVWHPLSGRRHRGRGRSGRAGVRPENEAAQGGEPLGWRKVQSDAGEATSRV